MVRLWANGTTQIKTIEAYEFGNICTRTCVDAQTGVYTRMGMHDGYGYAYISIYTM